MNFTLIRRHLFINKEMYFPYLYPILMPLLTLHFSKVSVHSPQDMLRYWCFTGFLQLCLLVIIQKTLYLELYNRPIRWLIATFLGFLIIWFYVYLDSRFLNIINQFKFHNNHAHLIRYASNVFILIALVEGIKSAEERKRIVLNNIMLENENAQAQLNLLLQQVNPHFLFNSLTVLQSMARSKDARTEEFILKLEEVYRQTLKKDKGTVTLQEELDFFNAYMYLMNLRQENAIFANVQVANEALNYHLPCFSLQLLAENCIKHNIASEAKPLTIHLYQKDIKTLTIANNNQPKAVKSESFGIGIKNLKKRYALEGIKNGIVIEQNDTTYSTTIKLF